MFAADEIREEARRVAASLLQDEVEEERRIDEEVRRRFETEKKKIVRQFHRSPQYGSVMDLAPPVPVSSSARMTKPNHSYGLQPVPYIPPSPHDRQSHESEVSAVPGAPMDEFLRIAAMEHQMREKLETERRLKEENERRRIEEERRRAEEERRLAEMEAMRAAAIERQARERLEAERFQAEYERQKRELEMRQRAEMEARRAEEERLRVEREIREKLEKEFWREKQIAAKAAEDVKRRADELESRLRAIEFERLQAAQVRRRAEEQAEQERRRLEVEREIARRVEEEKRRLMVSAAAHSAPVSPGASAQASSSGVQKAASQSPPAKGNTPRGPTPATVPVHPDPRQLVDQEIERRVSEVERRLSQELMEAKEIAKKAEREAARLAEERRREEELKKEKQQLDEEKAAIELEKARVEEEKRKLAEEKERMELAAQKKARDDQREERIAQAVRKQVEEQKKQLVGNVVSAETAQIQEELLKMKERAERKKAELENLRKAAKAQAASGAEKKNSETKTISGNGKSNLTVSGLSNESVGESKGLGLVDGFVAPDAHRRLGMVDGYMSSGSAHSVEAREKPIKVPVIASRSFPSTASVDSISSSASASGPITKAIRIEVNVEGTAHGGEVLPMRTIFPSASRLPSSASAAVLESETPHASASVPQSEATFGAAFQDAEAAEPSNLELPMRNISGNPSRSDTNLQDSTAVMHVQSGEPQSASDPQPQPAPESGWTFNFSSLPRPAKSPAKPAGSTRSEDEGQQNADVELKSPEFVGKQLAPLSPRLTDADRMEFHSPSDRPRNLMSTVAGSASTSPTPAPVTTPMPITASIPAAVGKNTETPVNQVPSKVNGSAAPVTAPTVSADSIAAAALAVSGSPSGSTCDDIPSPMTVQTMDSLSPMLSSDMRTIGMGMGMKLTALSGNAPVATPSTAADRGASSELSPGVKEKSDIAAGNSSSSSSVHEDILLELHTRYNSEPSPERGEGKVEAGNIPAVAAVAAVAEVGDDGDANFSDNETESEAEAEPEAEMPSPETEEVQSSEEEEEEEIVAELVEGSRQEEKIIELERKQQPISARSQKSQEDPDESTDNIDSFDLRVDLVELKGQPMSPMS